MCGIAGFINTRSHQSDHAGDLVHKMTRAIAHRGPDADGFYVDENAALGHRRLSIIDISSGAQPMHSSDNNYHIIFNGEIYNYLEIKKELIHLGHTFYTNSDTEVILAAYIQWNRDCVPKLNGMFAFAVWDKREQTLFAARDRVGKKPFYYIWDGQRLSFASEIKALLAAGFSKKQIDPKALDCYFSFGYIPVPFSIFKDIAKLPPAGTLTFKNNTLSINKYWDIDFSTPLTITMDEAVEEFNHLLVKAVKCRLMSEVPLGAFLSSGLDSTLVVSAMAQLMDKPVLTNTIGFGDPEYSELSGAKIVSDYLKTDHKEFIVQPNAIETLTDISQYFDEPFADSSALPTWHVCKMARQNVTVALSGDGGDESFGGYTFRYAPHIMESKIRQAIPQSIRGPLFSAIASIYPSSSRLPKPLRLQTIFDNLSKTDAQAFYQDLIWLNPGIRKKLYNTDFLQALNGYSPDRQILDLYRNNGHDALAKAQKTDIQFYMTDDVLVKTDRMSMAHALEVRCPLLDHRILEFAARLPTDLKIKNQKGKLVLRQLAAKKLPEAIQNLPKMGFSIPAASWLRGELKEFAHSGIFNSSLIKTTMNTTILNRIWKEHQSNFKDHSVLLWGLVMLNLWEENYNNG